MTGIVPLFTSDTQLSTHFATMSEVIATYTDAGATPRIDADWSIVPLAAGLKGAGCEPTTRNRGPTTIVAPLAEIKAGLWTWLGYREEWAPEAPAGQRKRFSFRSASMTVHLGHRSTLHKPQMFRAEWAGLAQWNGTEYGYQAGDAGHPHWQFDALESVRRNEVAERAQTYLAVLKQEQTDSPARDFVPHLPGEEETSDIVSVQELSRIHFASAAAFWKPAPANSHAHSPTRIQDLHVWVDRTLSYLSREMERL